jgi:hypothetical protein
MKTVPSNGDKLEQPLQGISYPNPNEGRLSDYIHAPPLPVAARNDERPDAQ